MPDPILRDRIGSNLERYCRTDVRCLQCCDGDSRHRRAVEWQRSATTKGRWHEFHSLLDAMVTGGREPPLFSHSSTTWWASTGRASIGPSSPNRISEPGRR